MSETTPCASTIATVCAHNCKGEQINIPVKDFPAYVGVDIAAPEARALKAKGQQLQMQVDTINQKIDRVNAMATNPEDKGIKQRLDDSEENIENLKEEGKQRDAVIGEIGDNITMLKNWSIRQDEKMEKLNKKVITDPIHYNFEEWVENVYAAQADAITNRYSEGDIYINTNQDVASTNTTYINIRKPGATTPPSANDWQEIYSPSAADMLTILGIDPVKVNHPGKHNWVISIDPNRLADMLANLRTLDLSKVDVTLGEVYFNPVFKEDAVIEQNLSVGDTLTVPKAEINTANIDRACIKEMVCDTKFTGNPTFDEVTITNKLDVGNVHIKGNLDVREGNIHLGGNSVVVPIIEGDTHFHDHVYAPNITVENKVEMKNLHVTRDTYIKGNIVFDGPITYKDANDAAAEPVCVDNLYKNLFRPSWGIFNMEGNLQGSGEPNGAVAGIGSNAIGVFNQAQQAPAHLKAV